MVDIGGGFYTCGRPGEIAEMDWLPAGRTSRNAIVKSWNRSRLRNSDNLFLTTINVGNLQRWRITKDVAPESPLGRGLQPEHIPATPAVGGRRA